MLVTKMAESIMLVFTLKKLTTYSLKCLFGFLIIFVISGSRCVTVACGG